MTTNLEAHADTSTASIPARPLGPIGLAFGTFILIGAMDGSVGVLLPSVGAHYAVDRATLGLVFPATSLGYLSAAFSSGPLLERLGRRAFLAVGAAALGLSALLISLMPPFLGLLPPLAAFGFGLGILDAGLNAYFASLPRSTALLNYLHAFYGGGALLGPIIASAVLTARWGWNTTYRIWALAAAVALVGFLALFARGRAEAHADGLEHADAHTDAHTDAHAAGGVLRAALRLRVVWLTAGFLFAYVGAEISVGAWSYSLLTLSRSVPALQASWMISGYWLGLTLGRVALGRVAERIGARRLVYACLAGAVAGLAAVWFAPGGAVAAAGLWLTGFSFGPLFPSTIALIGTTVPRRLQQSAIGLAASLGSMGAASLPWVAGTLGGQVGQWALLPFVMALCAVMLALWLALGQGRQASHDPA